MMNLEVKEDGVTVSEAPYTAEQRPESSTKSSAPISLTIVPQLHHVLDV